MLIAVARLVRATTETGATHRYELLVEVPAKSETHRISVTTSRAKFLGFAPIGASGLDQRIEGVWYPTQREFDR